ncbi:MAG: SGNH/GDSL hydrolase family protein [Allosphingosinicella sp.]
MGAAGRRGAAAANLVLGLAGAALLLLALRMGEGWAARHFLPAWAYGWDAQLRILLALRLFLAAVGLAILFLLRPWLVRACKSGRGRPALFTLLSSALAVILSLAATEGVLRTRTWRSVQERWDQEPKRVRDADYGWAFAPDHEGVVRLNGKAVHYATGPFSYRAPRAGVGPDFARPTLVFAGESMVFGYGLDFPDTVPAQAQATAGIQAANIAVNAHSTDQIYLRLRRELPRFARPVAVVIPFMSILFDRNLDRDRPHLDAGLGWHPAGKPPLRLVEMARRVTRYRSLAAIEEGTRLTRTALRASLALARARGARGIILVPQYLPESAREREVRRFVLDEGGIPYLLVPLRPEWRSPGHGHPNARGAKALADAVAGALRARRE